VQEGVYGASQSPQHLNLGATPCNSLTGFLSCQDLLPIQVFWQLQCLRLGCWSLAVGWSGVVPWKPKAEMQHLLST